MSRDLLGMPPLRYPVRRMGLAKQLQMKIDVPAVRAATLPSPSDGFRAQHLQRLQLPPHQFLLTV